MKKKSKRSHKTDENLLGRIREQKKEIRRLHQRIKQLERQLSYKDKSIDEKEPEDLKIDCFKCGKGILEEKTVVGRNFLSCPLCGWRSRATKI